MSLWCHQIQIGWSKAGELHAKPERAGRREAAVPNVAGLHMVRFSSCLLLEFLSS